MDKVYKEENILQNLSALFRSSFSKDWIGRVYTVLNPNLMENGEFSYNNQIYEYGANGLTNASYIERWIMERLNIANGFIQANNLFDLLVYDIKKIDDYDNYLFTMQPITLADARRTFWWAAAELAIIVTSLIIIL